MGDKDTQIWLPPHVLRNPLVDHSNYHQVHHHVNGRFSGSWTTPLKENIPLNKWQRSNEEARRQAFFMISPGRTASGTGVFIPATAFHQPTPTPLLLPTRRPARVIQTHNNDINVSSCSEMEKNDLKEKRENVLPPKNVEDETSIDSLLKLLPEEWTY